MSGQNGHLEVWDGQLHEFGPRWMGEVDDPALRRHIMMENILSSMEAVGVRGALLHPQDDGFEDLSCAVCLRCR